MNCHCICRGHIPYTSGEMFTAALLFTLAAGRVIGLYIEPFTLDPKMETDCSGPPAVNQVEVIPEVSYPFRTDYLTLHECKAYERVPCSPTDYNLCDVGRHGRTDISSISPFYKTYFELGCPRYNWYPGGWRSLVRAYTKKFSMISPKRALTMKIAERSDLKDPVHSDVFEPVRAQVIDITVLAVAGNKITSKIYDIGILPSLVALHIENGKDLSVRRHEFNRIPNVRLIAFVRSTIMEMEPYTFTDLPYISSLSVEKGLHHVFYEIEKHLDRVKWCEEKSSDDECPASMLERPTGLWNDTDFDKIHRIHCDCTFAWYRNFLKSKSELTDYFKPPGAMAVIGNYMSESVSAFGYDSELASVDCAKNLTEDNYRAGNQFSFNTTCFGSC